MTLAAMGRLGARREHRTRDFVHCPLPAISPPFFLIVFRANPRG